MRWYNDPFGFPFADFTLASFINYLVFSISHISPICTKLFAAFIGALSPLLFYVSIAKIVKQKIALLATLLFACWPSYVYHTLGGLKEPYVIFSVVFFLYCAVNFFHQKKMAFLIWVPCLFISLLVVKYVACIFWAMALCLLMFRFLSLRNCKKIAVIMFLCVISLPWILEEYHIGFLLNKHMSVSTIDDGGYKLFSFEEVKGVYRYDQTLLFKENGHLKVVPWMVLVFKGFIYAHFSPFLWNIKIQTQLLAYPQVLFSMFGFIFLLVGISSSMISNFRLFFPILFFLGIYTIGFSITEGNIGAAFRHRDLFLPLYIFLFSIGFGSFVKQQSVWVRSE